MLKRTIRFGALLAEKGLPRQALSRFLAVFNVMARSALDARLSGAACAPVRLNGVTFGGAKGVTVNLPARRAVLGR